MAVASQMVALGSPAPDFQLKSIDGGTFALADFAEAPALLVAFLCNHCPYVRHIEQEFGAVLAKHPELATVGICSNDTLAYPDDEAKYLREQRARTGWRFPYLVDEAQAVGRAYHAACTPDFFLYDADRKLAYRGAFDGSTPGNGQPVTGELLDKAIGLVLAGQPVPEPHKPSTGCGIKWRPGNEPE